jgi:hypothetical protein
VAGGWGIITRVAGTGASGSTGDDGPATEAQLRQPKALAVTADGSFLVADGDGAVVRKVSPAGRITRVAGNGTQGDSGDGGPATAAQLANPTGLALTADGGILIADWASYVVRKVSASGMITRVAGTGKPGTSGDGGSATAAELNLPMGLAVTADGGFLIAEASSCVRKVSSSGTITRVAGTGKPGNSGDDGPATDALLEFPVGLAITADGGFLIADSLGHVVRKVSASGTITRVAGTGIAGNGGDDGAATDAQLNGPFGLSATADGGFLIADAGNNVVRKVSADGTITRVAGTGTAGYSGDDGVATEAQLNEPWGVAATADGGFLVSEPNNHTVRKVSAAS